MNGEQLRPYRSDGTGGVILAGMRCAQCGHVAFPHQVYGCEKCGAIDAALRAVDLPARGVLTSHAVVRRHAGDGIEAPFVIGEVRLDDGPSLRVTMVEPPERIPAAGTTVRGVLVPVPHGDPDAGVELRFAGENAA